MEGKDIHEDAPIDPPGRLLLGWQIDQQSTGESSDPSLEDEIPIFGPDGKCLWCDGRPAIHVSDPNYPVVARAVTICPTGKEVTLTDGRVTKWRPVVTEEYPFIMKCICQKSPDRLLVNRRDVPPRLTTEGLAGVRG